MAVIGIKQTAWDGLRDNQRLIMKISVARLALGFPALHTDGTDEWFVFSDWRLDLTQVAILGALVVAVGGLPVGWEPPLDGEGNVDREATEALVIAFVEPTVVYPADITYTEIVDVEVPIYEWVEVPVLDEEGQPTGETVTVRRDTGEIEIIQAEQALPNPWQVTLDAQGAPDAICAAGNVPDGFTPVEVV